MKNSTLLLVLSVMLALVSQVHAIVLPEPNLFFTGFEADEGYTVDAAVTIGEPTVVAVSRSDIVSGGNSGRPIAPQGSAYASISRNSTQESYLITKPFSSNIESDFHMSLQLAWTGSMDWGHTADPLARVILGEHGGPDGNFRGITFGILGDKGDENLYAVARTRIDNVDINIKISETPLSQDVFYRYELDVNWEEKMYDIRVYGDELLGSLTNIAFSSTAANPLSFVDMIHYHTGSPFHTLYVDEVWVSTTPIPEVAHYGMGVILVLSVLVFRFRGRS